MSTVIAYTTTTSTAFAAVRASSYFEQASNAQRSFSSNDAADASAGTGARTIRITYFDSAMSGPFTETVTLNGTTAVNTVATDICFIESIVVLTVGSQLGNVGTITLHVGANGAGGMVGAILPGDNQTQWAHHYVASGKQSKITGIEGSIKGLSGGALHFRKATPTVANTPETTIAAVIRLPPGIPQRLSFEASPIVIAGPARMTAYARPDSAVAHDWQVSFDFYEV